MTITKHVWPGLNAAGASLIVYAADGVTLIPAVGGAIVPWEPYYQALVYGFFLRTSDPLDLGGDPISLPGGDVTGLPEGWFSVKDYGARGNYAAYDDTAAIQACIDAAAAHSAASVAAGGMAGGVVWVPPGVYKVSDQGTLRAWKLLLRSGVTILGAGRGVTVFRSALAQNFSARTFSSAVGTTLTNCTLRSFSIDGRESLQPTPDNSQRAGVFVLDCESVTVHDVEVRDTGDCLRFYGPSCQHVQLISNYLHSCLIDIGREVIQGEGLRNSLVHGNVIYDCPYATGIKMENATPGVITNNVVTDNVLTNIGTGIYMTGDGVTVANNRIIGAHIEGGIAVQGYGQVENNYIENVFTYGIVFASVGISKVGSSARGNQIRGVSSDAPTGSGTPYGILAAASGSWNPGKLVIESNLVEAFAGSLASTGVGISADQVTGPLDVSHNEIVGAYRGITVSPPAVGTLSGAQIAHNTVTVVTEGRGIVIGGDASAILKNVFLAGNTVTPAAGATDTIGIRQEGTSTRVTMTGNNTAECTTPISNAGVVTGLVSANNQGF